MGQTGRRSIATYILAVKIALGRLHFHSFGVARQGPRVTRVNRGKKKGRGCFKPRPYALSEITLTSLRSDHERVDLLAPAKIALVELELPVRGLVDLPAPLGAAVEVSFPRRWGHVARSVRVADSGCVVGMCVDGH